MRPARRRRDRAGGEPVALGDSLAAVGRQIGIPEPDALSTLTDAWPDIVGPALAGHAELQSVRDGVCTIAVDEAGRATRLRYAERQVLERAEACCGPGVVTAIRVVVGGPGNRSI
jgi:predicted nucleic acid-binding Zn ribbon protein